MSELCEYVMRPSTSKVGRVGLVGLERLRDDGQP